MIFHFCQVQYDLSPAFSAAPPDSRTGQILGRCWLTLLIPAHPRCIAPTLLHLTLQATATIMVLRLCVKRYGRLPIAITVDGGPGFQSVYFEQWLALYRVCKHQRPTAEPRFGSEVLYD